MTRSTAWMMSLALRYRLITQNVVISQVSDICSKHHKTLQQANLFHKLTLSVANPTKWSNKLKQFIPKLPTDFLSVLHHFVGLVFKVLTKICQEN